MKHVERLTVGELEENTYLIFDDSKKGMIIDPGAEGRRILALIREKEVTIEYIINTHGHFDHTGANAFIKEETGALLAIHRDDKPLLEDVSRQASLFGLGVTRSPEPDLLLKDGDILKAGDMELNIIHTPGHTAGGICIKLENILFAGDTIFAGSVGRTDLPGGSYEKLMESILSNILNLSDDTIIYSGHGPKTTVGEERTHNPFLLRL